MNRKEEIQNKLLELIEHVKDAPKKEALAAVGLDMAEWADKTMINKACEWLEEEIYVFCLEQKKEMIENFKKSMED